MSIWVYEDNGMNVPRGDIATCRFCRAPMPVLRRDAETYGPLWDSSGWSAKLQVCSDCGWWVVSQHAGRGDTVGDSWTDSRAVGSLRTLDLSDITEPADELRRYLLARYADRKMLNPEKFEHIVADVFASSGYRVRVTSYAGDDGVDVIVADGDANDTIGIQVKRYQGKIEASQIREFAGSLVLNGLTAGIFVTTSEFTRGATDTARRFGTLGIPVLLVDADRFYDCLRVRSRPFDEIVDDPSAPFVEILKHRERLTVIDSGGTSYD